METVTRDFGTGVSVWSRPEGLDLGPSLGVFVGERLPPSVSPEGERGGVRDLGPIERRFEDGTAWEGTRDLRLGRGPETLSRGQARRGRRVGARASTGPKGLPTLSDGLRGRGGSLLLHEFPSGL